MPLDACLTRHDEEGTGFASAADQRFFRQTMPTFDCAIMGGGGYRAARDPVLANRSPHQLRIVLTRTPDQYAGGTGCWTSSGLPSKPWSSGRDAA